MRLNEGLEKLGEKEVINGKEYEGEVFAWSNIETIVFPSTLKRMESETFLGCKNLKRIEIPNGVKYIGEKCFRSSGIEEIMLPKTLAYIDRNAFEDCEKLRTIYVEDGCEAYLDLTRVPDST